jgi:hypothetical protein
MALVLRGLARAVSKDSGKTRDNNLHCKLLLIRCESAKKRHRLVAINLVSFEARVKTNTRAYRQIIVGANHIYVDGPRRLT